MKSLYQRVLDIVQEEKLRLRAADDGTLERIETALVKMAPEEGVHVSNDRICIFDPETGKTLRSWVNPSPEMRCVALAVRDFYTETEN